VRKTLNSKQSSNLPNFVATEFPTFEGKEMGKWKELQHPKKAQKNRLAIYS